MPAKEKPPLSFWQIWNLCFGFLGIQFGFALQNANASRIFQTLGADMATLPLLWVAAPLTGLIVQPIVGYCSDRTWNFLGRRRPYFFFGALATTLALVAMPHSPTLWMAAGALWILDASINVTMEPFRAFVGDNLSPRQRPTGYVMQSFFIAVGAVVASALPWMFSNWFDVANDAPEGVVPDAVRYSFYVGAAVLCGAVLWTVFRTKEYSPEELASFADAEGDVPRTEVLPDRLFRSGSALAWFGGGVVGAGLVAALEADPQLYILAGGAAAFGLLQGIAIALRNAGRIDNPYFDLCRNLVEMPHTMRRLAWVQFFSWFALFAMWIYTTPAVASRHYGAKDAAAAGYNEGADWVGVLFAAYNLFAVAAAVTIPPLIKRLGLGRAHQACLLLGALGYFAFLLINDPMWLLAPMVGVGFAWASIVSVPYAMLANALPAARMGVFMGIFNFFIVIPQLLAAAVLGLIVGSLFGGEAIYALLLAGLSMLAAVATVQFVGRAVPGSAGR